MKDLFISGGVEFMGMLTLLLVITTVWIVYYFVIGYISKQTKPEKILKRIEYGKSIGLFALIVGFLGQLIGFTAMFEAIANVVGTIEPKLVYRGLRQTLICPMYGILIYLFALVLWFISSMLIEKKFEEV